MLETRPDLAYPAGLLGQFASDPSKTHWEGVLSVLKYLKHTSDLGITYSGGSDQLDGFSADFATSDPDRRRVTSGYIFRLWGGAISWQSKKQPSVSLATGDAEYVALAQAARELMWLRSKTSELGFASNTAITLYGDNQASIAIARNPLGHTRAKQIDIRYHYLRELVERGVISFEYITTNSVLADGLTNPLAPVAFTRFLAMLGLTAISNDSSSTSLAMTSYDIVAERSIMSPRSLTRSSISCSSPLDLSSSLRSLKLGYRSITSITMPSEIAQAQIDRAHYVLDNGHTARSGCTACIALDRECIVLPTSDARKLNKCFQCTLSKQKCSIDRILAKDEFEDQTLSPRQEFSKDTSDESMSINADHLMSMDAGSIGPTPVITPLTALAALDKAIRSTEASLDDLKRLVRRSFRPQFRTGTARTTARTARACATLAGLWLSASDLVHSLA